MKSTFSVIYYLKRQVVKKDGTVPVMGRITVDGSQTQFSCKLTVDPKLWDTKGGRVTGRSTAALEANRMLDKMRVRINRHYQEIMERDNFVTAEKVKNAFLGLEHRYHTLMQVFRQHNEDYEKQVEAGMKAKGTLEKYRIVYKHLQEFLDIRYHVKDIALKELTPAFISDFEMFLRTDKHCCTNTVWLYVCPLRTMVFIAINNEWLTRDPFREYEIKKEETTRSFLTKDEIRLLMEGKLKNAKQELYRDLYLFCAFTGLSFADMRNLTEENIRTYFDEHEWININRQKTGVVSNIRLLDIANRIIGKYRGLCENGRIFPVPHYNTCLAGIRAVAKRCGITKHITWHQSRHTAATTVFLSNGVPIETLFKRGYMERCKKLLVPTEKGLALNSVVKTMRIADVAMTGEWEKELARIERGELSADTFRKKIEAYTREITSELLSCDKLFGSRDSGCACPKCGTGRMRFYGKVVRCDNTECGLLVFRLKAGRTLSDDEIKDLLTDGHTKLLKGFKSKQGKNFDAIVAFDGDYNTTFVFPEKKCKSSYPKKRK